jgi:Domain of unknown function (DUF4268)
MGYAPELQLNFFTGLVETMRERRLPFKPPKPARRHWIDLPLGTSRAHIALCALGDGRLRCELYSDHPQSGIIYEMLLAERSAIEAEREVAGKLDWQPLPGRKSIRIALHNDIGSLDGRERWPEAYTWMLDWAVKFKNVFDRRLKDMAIQPHGAG